MIHHRQMIAAVILGLAGLYVLKVCLTGKFGWFEAASFGLYGYCMVVSWYSNTWLFPQDWGGWVIATYSITPCLLLPALRVAGYRAEEIIAGLLWTGIVASVIVVADQLLRFSVLDTFVRGASLGGERRVIFLKTEAACALIILFARAAMSKHTKDMTKQLFLMAFVVINLVVVTESRLAVGAVCIATVLTTLLAMNGRRRRNVLVAGGLAVAVVGPLLLSWYVEQILMLGDLATEDPGVSWRLKTIDYFYHYFEQTGGIGFGIMSTNVIWNNPIAWAFNYGGIYAGIGKYPMALSDTGIMGALTQFGYAGLLIVVVMTLAMAWRLMKVGRGAGSVEIFALGALVFTYMLSPLPMNFFTLEWTVLTGNLLWALAALSPMLLQEGAIKGSQAALVPAHRVAQRSNNR